MRESLIDRCLLIFVLLVAVLLLFLMLAESPSGQHLPAAVLATSMVVGMVATVLGVMRSKQAGWSKPVVPIVGAAFLILAAWTVFDPPVDYHRTLSSAALGLVLLGSAFDHRKRRRSDEATAVVRSGDP